MDGVTQILEASLYLVGQLVFGQQVVMETALDRAFGYRKSDVGDVLLAVSVDSTGSLDEVLWDDWLFNEEQLPANCLGVESYAT